MVNVPSAVWINEEGKIVRPAEPAGWNDAWRTSNLTELERSKSNYFDALRNWAKEGDLSSYVLEPNEVRTRMTGPTDEQALASTHFRMGLYLTELEFLDEAKYHFDKAIDLHPKSWNFKRQSWWLVNSKEEQRNNFIEALGNLKDQPYYPIVHLNSSKK